MRTGPNPPAVAVPAAEETADSGLRRTLRQAARARRLHMDADARRRFSLAICRHLTTRFPSLAEQRVAFCWPVRGEPDLRPAIAAWQAGGRAGFAALLPVVVAADAPLAFRAWAPETPTREDRYGIPTPTAGDFLLPQAVLVPLLAVDAAGYRLGYGGGYFDRTLAALRPRPLAIGIGFADDQVADTCPETHDERLDALVTEAGVTFFGDRGAGEGGGDRDSA